MAKTRNKKQESSQKKERRKEQIKLAMRRNRARLTEEQIEERRRKDRERYRLKKEKGLIKSVDEMPPRVQRIIRKQWKTNSKKYRDCLNMKKQIEKQTNNLVDYDTPLSSPAPSTSLTSRSRTESGKKVSKKNRRILMLQNAVLKSKLQLLEKRVNKYKVRLNRTTKILKEIQQETKVQNKGTVINNKKRLVQEFLERDECSRLTAGKKETITKRKIKKQIRLLNDTMLNLYVDFMKTVHCKISYSLFCRYRPFWILSPLARKRNTTLCTQHENVEQITSSLKFAKVIQQSSPIDLVKSICCEGKLKEECLTRKCKECKNKKIQFNSFPEGDSVFYYRWITKKIKVVIKGKDKICQKTMKEQVRVTKKELTNILIAKLPDFMLHLNNIFHQYHALNVVKRHINKDSALLHIDFAENYNCKYAQEVQSAHFGASKPQISLHTSVLYHFDTSVNSTAITSYCTIAENLRHDPVFICAHLLPILRIIKSRQSELKTMHFVSDGPSSQYRNKSMFYLVANFIAVELNVENVLWHFNEAGHGKGAPDGVGGTVKRTADQAVANGRDVSNFEQFKECLKDGTRVQVIPIDESEIGNIESLLAKSVTPTFKGTLNIHQITWNRESPGLLHARKLSCTDCDPKSICPHYEMGYINVEPKFTERECLNEEYEEDYQVLQASRPPSECSIHASSLVQDELSLALASPVSTHSFCVARPPSECSSAHNSSPIQAAASPSHMSLSPCPSLSPVSEQLTKCQKKKRMSFYRICYGCSSEDERDESKNETEVNKEESLKDSTPKGAGGSTKRRIKNFFDSSDDE